MIQTHMMGSTKTVSAKIISHNQLSKEKYTQEWAALARECSSDIFSYPEWLIPWLRVYGKSRKLFFILFHEDDELIGVLPLIEKGNFLTKRLVFIGLPHGDIGPLLIKAGYERRSFICLSDLIKRGVLRFSTLEVNLLDAKIAQNLVRELKVAGLFVLRQKPETRPQIIIHHDQDRASRVLKRNCSHLRSFKNKVRDARLDTSMNLSPVELEKYVRMLNRYRLDSWRSRGRIRGLSMDVREESYESFLVEVVKELGKKGMVILPRLTSGSEIISLGLYLKSDKRVIKYMQGWNYKYASYSPGGALDSLMINEAITDGVEIFDFGVGNEGYKCQLGATDLFLENYVVFKKGVTLPLYFIIYSLNHLLAEIAWHIGQLHTNS
jgi:CelD/BcsL family acetyltransferase involved in cellulose biosynthesis